MKPIYYIYILLFMLLASSCEATLDSGKGDESCRPGKLVQVSLSLLPHPGVAGTRPASDSRATMSEPRRDEGEAVLMLPADELPADREATTRAMDENSVSNFWILQFDGTAQSSKLLYKKYVSSGTDTTVDLAYSSSTTRVVVVANTFSNSTFNGLAIGSSTLANFEALYQTVTATAVGTNGGNSLLMSGALDAFIVDGSGLLIPLKRTLAKVTFKIKLGAAMSGYTPWTVQLKQVQDKDYYYPHARTGTFPATTTTVDFDATTVALNTTTAIEVSWYVPANQRGSVAGTTGKTRYTNAPAGATYLEVKGSSDAKDVIYRLHLGKDMITDYNLLPNYNYSYTLTLAGENTTDSRVEVEEKNEVVGYFGGELRGFLADGTEVAITDSKAVEYRYNKKLVLADTDETGTYQWATAEGDHSALAGNKVVNYTRDGRGNTWRLYSNSSSGFPAAAKCVNRNGAVSGLSDSNYKWYLPAQEQLRAMWVYHNSFRKGLSAAHYWSATEYNSGISWSVNFGDGSGSDYKTSSISVRCVREF